MMTNAMYPPPKSLNICGILNIVFGALGIFAVIYTLALQFSPLGKTNPAIAAMQKFPEIILVEKIMLLPGLAMCVLAIASGVALRNAREWARKAAIVYGVWSLLNSIGSIWVNYKIMPEVLASIASKPNLPAEAVSIIKALTGFGIVAGVIFGAAYPICLIALMTRPRVRAACSGLSPTPPPLPQ